MDLDDALNALAAKHPALRRSIAEYADDGKAAIDRYMLDHPVEAVAIRLDMERLRRGESI